MEVFDAAAATKEEIIVTIKGALEEREEIVFAYLFGSFVDEGSPFFRDIDVAVYLKEGFTPKSNLLDYSIALSLELERLVSEYPVDLVVLNTAPLPVAFHVTEGSLLFSRDEGLWTDFVTKTWALYHEHSITSRHVLDDLVSA